MSLSRYELEDALGMGGMGAVLGARRRGDDAELAIKFLSGLRAQDARARADFAHEIWSLARLDHPGIVGVIDWGVVDADEADPASPSLITGTPYLVMERARGHMSHALFPESWDALVPMVQQILAALAHAHARNVVHRDLKPSNVLFTVDDQWKLADFGIAHALDRHAADRSWGRTVGTPAYMAPEQIAGSWRDFGPWTDLYAVGVLIYELITGTTPFVGLTSKELMQAVIDKPIPAPRGTRFPVPSGLDDFLARLLERNFLDRAQRAADVSLWLEQLGRAEPANWIGPLPDEVASGTTMTIPLDGIDTSGIPFRALPEGPAPVRLDRRPIPDDWRPLETASAAPEPHETSIPRALPFTGREAERDRIWAALTRVDRGDGAHAVVIRGDSGSGRTALARWVLERAHELGAAWQLVATHSDPPRPLDGVGAMFATFLRSVGLPRDELVERMRVLLQIREGSGGLEHVITEIIQPAPPDDDVPVRFSTLLERNAASLGAIQLVTGVLGGDNDTLPLRNVVALIDDAHLAEEGLGLVHLALANREGLRTPVLFLLTVDDGGPLAEQIAAIEALDGAMRIDLPPLPDAVRQALAERQETPGVEFLRTEVGPPVPTERDALERAIHETISGTATTGDDL